MSEINYKQGKLVLPVKEFLIEKGVYQYEINGIEMGTSVVLYKEELGIFKVMPKGDFQIIGDTNNQYLKIVNEKVFETYLSIQIVSIKKLISSIYEPSSDIDINTMLHEMNNVIQDVHEITDYLKKTNQIVDSEKATNVFPDLPIGSTVIKLEDGTLGGIPISDMYEHFDRLTDRIYNTVLDRLNIDYQNFKNGMLQYSKELEQSIKDNIEIYVTEKFEEFDNKVTESENKITQKGEEVLEELGKFDPNGLVTKVVDLENTRVLRSGDTMTGSLLVMSAKPNTSVSIYHDGFIDINRTDNPAVVRFFTEGNTQGCYVGRYGSTSGINALNMGNTIGNAFYRIYDNGIHEILGSQLQFNSQNLNGMFKMKTTKEVGLSWGYSARIVFDNDNKEATFTGLGNQGMFVFSTPINSFPIFRMIKANAEAYDVNIVTMNTLLNTINSSYLNKNVGGTIFGGVDVQNGHSANSYYSRGTITSAGAITSSSNVVAYSDIRLKENLKPLTDTLDMIDNLNVYHYNWKDTKKEDIGVIAQEVEKIFPELVIEIDDPVKGKIKGVDYGKLATVSLQAIKELKQEITQLKAEIKTIKEAQYGYFTQNQ